MRRIVIFICLALMGICLLPFLSVSLVPSASLPEVNISFSMPGHSALVIENMATSRIEAAVGKAKGVRNIKSTSDNGYGKVTVQFDRHTDVNLARFEVASYIRQIWSQMPEAMSYPQITTRQIESDAMRPFLVYTLNAPVTSHEMIDYGEKHILPRLSRINGISKAELDGETKLCYRIVYDQTLLSQLGLSEANIVDAISKLCRQQEMGFTVDESGLGWTSVVVAADKGDREFNLSSVFLTTSGGKHVRLDEIAQASVQEMTPTSIFRVNGQPSITLSITAEKDANQLTVGNKVKQEMENVASTLPKGYELQKVYDGTDYIMERLSLVFSRSWMTVLILVVFMALVYRSVRYVMMMVVSLAVSLLMAFIFYYAKQVEIHIYSLAGITISLNLIIDNIIVMADRVRRGGHKTATAELAATLTTVGAMSVMFLLDEKNRLTLTDFTWVIIMNLVCSLLVACFFVPSLMRLMRLDKRKDIKGMRQRVKWPRLKVKTARCYARMVNGCVRFRVLVLLLVTVMFGLSLWQFVKEVSEGTYFNQGQEEVVLSASVTLPNGTTMEETDHVVAEMESFLSAFPQVSVFQTSIYDACHASIDIHFKKEYQHGGFPYSLKTQMVSKALGIGGCYWSIYGLEDQGFSNDVRESTGYFQVNMYGYNYAELSRWAESFRQRLLQHRRIKEVTILPEHSYWKDDYQEYQLTLDKEKMARAGITPRTFYAQAYPLFVHETSVATVTYDQQSLRLEVQSRQGRENDVWALLNVPITINGKQYKVSSFATLEKVDVPRRIIKKNQQYQLVLLYDYIGSYTQGEKILKQDVEQFSPTLPMGYSVQLPDKGGNAPASDGQLYGIALLAVVVIWFILAIFFNSLRRPFAIMLIVPVAYMGLFIAFPLLEMKMDEGCLAAFVFLAGITVNAGIFVVDEYQYIRKVCPKWHPLRAYVKACNRKVIPIFLTQVSTILGFIPFLVGSHESFWFNLAVGVMSGLTFSLLGVFVVLPLFLLRRKCHPSGDASSMIVAR